MRLQKYLSAAAATIAIFAVTTSAAHAASTTADINVSASLTAFCENTTSAGNPVVSFTYQSFDAAINNQAADKPLTWRCTRGLTAPTMILDGGTSVAGAVGGAAATGAGVIAANGLYYTLSISGSKTTTGVAPTAAGGLNASDADVYTFTITGSLPQQAGSCASGPCSGTDTRTLTVTY